MTGMVNISAGEITLINHEKAGNSINVVSRAISTTTKSTPRKSVTAPVSRRYRAGRAKKGSYQRNIQHADHEAMKDIIVDQFCMVVCFQPVILSIT